MYPQMRRKASRQRGLLLLYASCVLMYVRESCAAITAVALSRAGAERQRCVSAHPAGLPTILCSGLSASALV